MKVFSLRVPEEVKEKLTTMDKDYIRKVLTEVAGMVYEEKTRLIQIEDVVRRYIEENMIHLQVNKKEVVDKDLTSKAMDSILDILG